MNEKIESLKGKSIVSHQALPHEPLHSAFIMGRMVLVVKEDGVYGIHANTKEGIAEIQTQVDLPVIGIVKCDYEDSKVYITPTMKEINEPMEVKSEIIVPDVIDDLRLGGRTLDEFYREIRKSYPGQLLMAGCSTVEEVLHADQLGFDFIETTLVGYADQSRNFRIEPNDFKIIRRIVATVEHRVIAEGSINTLERAKRAIELGAFSVVVGLIIIRSQLITKFSTQTLD